MDKQTHMQLNVLPTPAAIAKSLQNWQNGQWSCLTTAHHCGSLFHAKLHLDRGEKLPKYRDFDKNLEI